MRNVSHIVIDRTQNPQRQTSGYVCEEFVYLRLTEVERTDLIKGGSVPCAAILDGMKRESDGVRKGLGEMPRKVRALTALAQRKDLGLVLDIHIMAHHHL